MKPFVALVCGLQPLTNVTKCSILEVAKALKAALQRVPKLMQVFKLSKVARLLFVQQLFL